MPFNYKLTHWDIHAGTGDVGATIRAQIAKAALTLQDHPDVVFAASSGGYNNFEEPEIALLVPIDYFPLTLQSVVERTIHAEGLTAKVYLKNDAGVYNFTDTQLASIARAAYISDIEAARAQIDALAAIPAEPSSRTPASTSKEILQKLADHISKLQLEADADPAQLSTAVAAAAADAETLSEVSVDAAKYLRMKTARGEAIEKEFKEIQEALELVEKSKTASDAALQMVARGIVTIGQKMFAKYKELSKAEGLIPMVVALIGVVGVPEIAAVAAVIAILFGFLFVIFKPAVNTLVLVNGSQSEIAWTDEYIINGVRNGITPTVSAAPDPARAVDKPLAYPCGIYVYSKYNLSGVPIGLYGSTLGIGYTASDSGQFSFGMDCPLTLIGGTNGIQLMSGNVPKAVAEAVNSKSLDTASIKVGRYTCTLSRADGYGSINYCMGWIGI